MFYHDKQSDVYYEVKPFHNIVTHIICNTKFSRSSGYIFQVWWTNSKPCKWNFFGFSAQKIIKIGSFLTELLKSETFLKHSANKTEW